MTTPPGAQQQEGCHVLLFLLHLQTEMAQGLQGRSGVGLQSLGEGTGSTHAARLGWQQVAFLYQKLNNGSAGSKESFPTTRRVPQNSHFSNKDQALCLVTSWPLCQCLMRSDFSSLWLSAQWHVCCLQPGICLQSHQSNCCEP